MREAVRFLEFKGSLGGCLTCSHGRLVVQETALRSSVKKGLEAARKKKGKV